MNRSTFSISKIIFVVTIFSIAMGIMEGAVVVYLRKIYYPGGFEFPLIPIGPKIAITEIIREAATLIMLISTGIIAGRTKTERFGFFIFCFGVWDITYYLVLYFILGWPQSLLTWDILFLIPVTWVGPVLGPVINSLSMILLALLVSYFTTKNPLAKVNSKEWALLVIGSLIVIVSYTEDYVGYMLGEFSLMELLIPTNSNEVMDYAIGYVPQHFAWWVFGLGQGIIFLAIFLFYFRKR